MKRHVLILGFVFDVFLVLTVRAQVPERVSFQGRMAENTNLVNGPVEVVFGLYDSDGLYGNRVYAETQTVAVVNGLFTAIIGASNGVPGALASATTNTELWLQLDFNGETLTPRMPIASSFYAIRAGGVVEGAVTADMLADGAITSAKISDEPLTLLVASQVALRLEPGSGAAVPNVIEGSSHTVATSGGVSVGGGEGNSILAGSDYASVGGGRFNTISSGYGSIVGGGEGNSILASSHYASVGGGTLNTISNGQWSIVGGGVGNMVGDDYSVVAGGRQNTALAPYVSIGGGLNNSAQATFSTIAGGAYNQVGANYGTIGGGGPTDPGNPSTSNNRVFDEYGTVGGGGGNNAGKDDSDATSQTYASVAGGRDNTASAQMATVGGGGDNQATGYAATVGGGVNNLAGAYAATVGGGYSNRSTNNYASIGGGRDNAAGANYATVGGGYGNKIEGAYGTIPGGFQNHVGANFGFAAGRGARAEHEGAIVFGDATATPIVSTAPNQFIIQASGGVGIGTAVPSSAFTINGAQTIVGGDDPTPRGALTTTNKVFQQPVAVYVTGKRAYVVAYATNVLSLNDVSDPDHPRILGISTSGLNKPTDVQVMGDRAYVTSEGNNSLVIVDVSDPSDVGEHVWSTDKSLRSPLAVYVSGKYAYVASSGTEGAGLYDGLAVFDVSDPTSIGLTGFIDTNLEGANDVFVSGRFAYVTGYDNNTLAVFDVSRPDFLQAAGASQELLDRPTSVFVSDHYAFVTMSGTNGLAAFDVANPGNIVALGSINDNLSDARDVFVAGGYAYVSSYANDLVAVFDVSAPDNMVAMGFTSEGLDGPGGLFVAGSKLYVVSELNDQVCIFDVNHLTSPALEVGSMLAGSLDVTDHASVQNYLSVAGGLNVGSGALIGGELAAVGRGTNYISGPLGLGGIDPTRNELAVAGEVLFRLSDISQLDFRSWSAGFSEDAFIDFYGGYSLVSTDAAPQTIMFTNPLARIRFDRPRPEQNAAALKFYTKGSNDTTVIDRVEITEEGDLLPGSDNAYALGSSTQRWSAVYAANGTIQTSDGRLKQDVQELDAGLAKVEQLRPVTFQWKDGMDRRTHLGLIAQEVAEVVPEVVVGDEQSGLGMNYAELVPVLIKALQEQEARINEQEVRIQALEQELAERNQDTEVIAAPPEVP